MPARRDLPPDLLARARRGELRRSNTVAGTADRRAADRVTYERRAARAQAQGLTVRQGLGHPGAADVGPAVSLYVTGPARLLVGVETDRRAARRVGTYMEATRRMLDGRLAPAAFDKRFGGWAPVVIIGPPELAGTYGLAAAAEVIALDARRRAADEELVFDSGRRRPVRRRQASRRRSRP